MQPRSRLAWIDAARGVCVLAIVLFHFLIWIWQPEVGDGTGPTATVWGFVAEALGKVRLPLLFTLSGFIVADRIRAGLSDRRNLLRVANSYWLYVVWLVIFALISVIIPAGWPLRVNGLASFAKQLILPRTILWFVLALAIWTLVLALLHRVPPALVLAGLAVVSVLTRVFPFPSGESISLVLYYGFFFGLGVYARSLFRYATSSGMWWKAPALLAAYLLVSAARNALPANPVSGTLTGLAASTLMAMTAASIVALLCLVPHLARWLGAIGQQTLPIYVMQLPVLWFLIFVRVHTELFASPIGRAIGPVLGVAFVVAVTLVAHRLLMRTPLRILFGLPERWADRIVRRPPARASVAAPEQ